MTLPTLPNMWPDTLAMFNTFLSWDIVKGALVVLVGMPLAGVALRQLEKALH